MGNHRPTLLDYDSQAQGPPRNLWSILGRVVLCLLFLAVAVGVGICMVILFIYFAGKGWKVSVP